MPTYSYYVDIGRGTVPSTSYIRIHLKRKKDNPEYDVYDFYDAQHYDEDGRLDPFDLIDFKIIFIKRRYRGLKIADYPDTNSRQLTVRFKGGTDSSETQAHNHESFYALAIKIASWMTGEYGSTSQSTTDSIAENPNIPWYYDFEIFGNAADILPFNPDVDNGDEMFQNPFTFNEYIEEEEEPINPWSYLPVLDVQAEDLPDPEAGISNFSSLQTEVCQILPTEEEPENPNPNLFRVCPTCIPNLNFVEPDWTSYDDGEVWLNELTCEYTVALTIEDVLYSDYLQTTFILNNEIFPVIKRTALIEILAENNKVIREADICANPPTSPGEDCGNIDKNLIDAYTIERQIPSGQGDGTVQTIYSLNPEIYEQIEIENPNALELYTRIPAYAPSILNAKLLPADNAKLRVKVTIPANLIDIIPIDVNNEESDETQQEDPADEIIFQAADIENYFDSVLPNVFKTFGEYHSFYSQTEGGKIFINTNNGLKPFYTRPYREKFSEFYDDLVALLKKNGYRLPTRFFPNKLKLAQEVKITFEVQNERIQIKKVLARYVACPFRTCRKGIQKFKEDYNTIGNETLLNYVSKANNMVKEIERAKIAPPWKEFLAKYTVPQITFTNSQDNPEAESCIDNDQERIFEDLLLESELSFGSAVEYACNSLNCRDIETWDQAEYKKQINKTLGIFDSDQVEDLKKTYADYRAFGVDLTIDSGMQQYFSNLIKKSNTDNEPFFNRLVGMSLVEMKRKMDKNPDKAFGILLNKVNPCNWESLTLDLLKCMLKGLNPIESLEGLAKSLLSGLDLLSFEDVFLGLPIETQNELTAEIRETIGDLELPWDYQKRKDRESKQETNAYQEAREDEQSPSNPQSSELSDEEVEEVLEESNEIAEEKIEINNRLEELSDLIEKIEAEIIKINAANEIGAQNEVEMILAQDGSNSIGDYIVTRREAQNFYTQEMTDLGHQLQTIEAQFIKSQQTAQKQLEYLINRQDVNPYEKAFREVSNLIIEAYTELIIQKLSYNELKELINNIPGSNIFAPVVAAAECATTSFLDSWLTASINNVELNPCRGKYGWQLPEISKFPEFDFLNILKVFLAKFLERLIPKLLAALLSYMTRTFEKIINLTCDLFEGFGRHLLGNDDTTLFDAIADAFCNRDDFTPFSNSLPQAGDNIRDAENTLNDILSRYGANDVPAQTARQWVDAISRNVNSTQFKELFLGGDSTGAIDAVWEATQNLDSEQFNDIFTSIEDIQAFFALIGASLTTEQSTALENYLDQVVNSADDNETIIEICNRLCQPEDNSTSGIEFDTNEFDNDDTITDYVGGFVLDFNEILSNLQNGPDSGIINAIDEVIDPFSGDDPYCSDLNDPDDPMNISGKKSILKEVPQELKDFQKTVADSVIEDLEISYQYDLIGSRKSFFNNVLADKNHARLSRGSLFHPSHEFRAKAKFLFPNAADTKRDQRQKWSNAIPFGPLRLAMRMADNVRDFTSDEEDNTFFKRLERAFDVDGTPDPTNLYPKTVGKWLYTQILSNENSIYNTRISISDQNFNKIENTVNKNFLSIDMFCENVKVRSPVVQDPDYVLTYEDYNNNEGATWGFDLHYNSFPLYSRGPTQDGATTEIFYYKNSPNPAYQLCYLENEFNRPRWDTAEDWLIDTFGESIKENYGKKKQELKWQINVPLPLENYSNVLERLSSNINNDATVIKNNAANASNYTPPGYATQYHKMFYDYIETNKFYNNNSIVKFDRTKFGREQEIKFENKLNDQDLDRNIFNRISKQFFNVFTSKVFSSTRNKGLPNGFKFGYKFKSKITHADLLYVNPEATNNPSTWEYTYENSDKVLGKSATDNPRVMFLDPEIYGGSYKKPKVYVRPADYTGWLGIMQSFLPEDDGCEPNNEDWLFGSEVSKRMVDVENKLTKDKRLQYDPDCLIHPPYDFIADSSTHAYLDGIVLMTIRAYLVEYLLRTVPVISNLRFNSRNYDSGIGLFIMNHMEEEMRETPDNVFGGMVSKHNYWYVFLEQMVQSVEKKIIFGEIEKDNNLDQLFTLIKQAKKEYTQPSRRDYKFFKYNVGTISFDQTGDPIRNSITDYYGNPTEISLDYFENKIKPFMEAISFNAFGPNFKQYLKNKNNMVFSVYPHLNLKRLIFYTKVYSIFQTEETAKEISSYLILNEFNYYKDKVNQTFPEDPYIEDISKFVLNPKSGMTIGLPIEIGTTVGERSEFTANVIYGDVMEVSDNPLQTNPLNQVFDRGENMTDQFREAGKYGKFFLEKYIKVSFGGFGGKTPTEIRDKFEQIGNNFYEDEPMSITKFKEVMTLIRGSYNFAEGTHISDYFGNAQISEDGLTYTGTTGIKFGVRLSYLTPKGFNYDSVTEDLDDNITELSIESTGNTPLENLAKVKKTYKFGTNKGTAIVGTMSPHVIPLMDYEQDLPDKTIAEFYNDFNKSNLSIPLKCYVDKICNSDDYKFLMEFCFPTKRIPTINSVYSFYGFTDSIGEHPDERDFNSLDKKEERWKEQIMGATKLKAYRLFKKFYKTFEFDRSESSDNKQKKRSKKLLLPSINLNITDSVKWWQRKRFHDRPFDKDGRECLDGAIGVFNQDPLGQKVVEDRRVKPDDFTDLEDDSSFLLDEEGEPVIFKESDKVSASETFDNYDPVGAFDTSNSSLKFKLD